MKRPLALLLALAPALLCQSRSLSQGPHRMEITLERRDGSNWRAVDPGLIFQPADRVRFRIRTNFSGHLYVMNQTTSGRYTLLFPSEEAGDKNQIESGREYVVPATQGWFRIAGPPGHEVVYWLVTPVELQSEAPKYIPLPPPPKPGKVPPNLLPRCDDTILRARGDCVDTSAGPKAISDRSMPENLAQVSETPTRDLLFMRQQNASVVAAPATLTGPVIFEFRLAHR